MSHYSLAQKPAQLSKWARSICGDIINRKIVNPVLVYSGMSGVSSATAISLRLHALGYQHGMVYIRKQNEVSHGCAVEYEHTSGKDRTYIFVDDFIDRCETLNYCHDKMLQHHDFTQFSFLALQKSDYDYNDQLMKPEDSERAHHIKFLEEGYVRPKVKAQITLNPEMGRVWTRFFEDYKGSDIKNYSGYWVDEMTEMKPIKVVKPKQTIPYWANDWRRK